MNEPNDTNETNQSGWTVSAVAFGPGRLFRGGKYDVAVPPAFNPDCYELADWLNERSEQGWKFLTVHNGMFIFEKV